MKHTEVNLKQGRERKGQGLSAKVALALLGAALMSSPFANTASAASADGITQLEYIQWLVQFSGESGSFNGGSSSADYVQWAASKGLNPAGGWNADGTLSGQQLADTLVQLLDLNANKAGGDSVKILAREGINVPTAPTIDRAGLSLVLADFGFQSRVGNLASQETTGDKPGNGGGHGYGWFKNGGGNGNPPLVPPGQAKKNNP